VPPDDARLALDPATVLSVVVANLCIEHRPLYALGEWAAAYEPALLGLAEGQAGLLNDDRAGRMLDLLFLADRGSLLTELITGMISKFGIDCSRLHTTTPPRSVCTAPPRPPAAARWPACPRHRSPSVTARTAGPT